MSILCVAMLFFDINGMFPIINVNGILNCAIQYYLAIFTIRINIHKGTLSKLYLQQHCNI